MIRCRAFLLAILLFPSVSLPAQTVTFWLKNTDRSALFCYWAVPVPVPTQTAAVLGGLPLAPRGRHPVAPGERVLVALPENHTLVGVFVPWAEAPGWTTPLYGGTILASEAPARGTLLVDRPSFQAFNQGRLLVATLQEWGLEPSLFVLDGRSEDWAAVPMLLEWGPAFLPSESSWPPGFPRLLGLQMVDRKEALWIRLTFENKPFPSALEASLVLRRPGAAFEWPLTGNQGLVWAWDDTPDPRVVGGQMVSPGMLEAWIPWDRLPPAVRTSWRNVPATWQLVTSGALGVKTYDLAPFSWEVLP